MLAVEKGKGMDKGYYLVRAMSQSQEDFDVFFENNVVAVGWSKVNFSQCKNSDLLIKEVGEYYYSDSGSAPQVIGKKKNECRRFKGMKKGDRIVVPFLGAICLAEVEKEELYSQLDQDLSNQRKVTYLRDQNEEVVYIPRDKLSEGLQRRLRVRGTTIADLREFSDEIDNLFKGEDFDSGFNKKRIEAINSFKKQLLKNIQRGKTNLQSGGYGLEKLIKELLEIDGYKAEIQSKQRFSGLSDADIKAEKEDFLLTEKLLVQVKHHSGITGTWGAKQLTEILNSEKDLFSEYRLVLVTSAIPSGDLIKLCENQDIILVSGNDLSEWVFKSLPQLRFDTKKRLSISDIPTLLN